MRIKELHLRNIASIEKADIDFENGIVDKQTGSPAGIFLISGDTGTGKSVILDGIALALYKKTPRTVGVANKTNNDFRDNQGQSVSINSIEQYTRLGISEKDECYSELVFEGNDGKEYRARLELGIVKGNTNASGQRPLKHRSPSWTVQVGGEAPMKVDARSGEPILSAIGLTFEQFGRMAMLAQGQFASFLTGDKTEREQILEQLTNTEHFSDYGTAISNLFSAAKEGKKIAEAAYTAESSHMLPTGKLEELQAKQQELTTELKRLADEKQKAEERLSNINGIAEAQKDKAEATARKTELQEVVQGDEYRQRKALVTDWDSTDKERTLLKEKNDATAQLEEGGRRLEEARTRFDRLSADLAFREAEIEKRKEETAVTEKWIADRTDRDELFTKADAVAEKMTRFHDTCVKASSARTSLQEEKGKTDGLTLAVSNATSTRNAAEKAVKDKEAEIEKLNNERTALNPAKINDDIEALSNSRNALGKLRDDISDLAQKKTAADRILAEIQGDTKDLERLKAIYDEAQKEFDVASKAEEETRRLLSTMEMSLDVKLRELRMRLQEDHAETCPLCGQHITTVHIDDDFDSVLSPLKQREEESKKVLEARTKDRDEAKSRYDKLSGELTGKRNACDEAVKGIQSAEAGICMKAEGLGLDPSQSIPEQIDAAMEKASKELETLRNAQRKVVSLQDEVGRLSEEKKPLDRAFNESERGLAEARNALAMNGKEIANLLKDIEELDAEKDATHAELAAFLTAAYPGWVDNVITAKERLQDDAREYRSRKEEAEKARQETEKTETTLASARTMRNDILKGHADWSVTSEPRLCSEKDITASWNGLSSDVNHQDAIILKAKEDIAHRMASLEEYYTKTGKTEELLTAITRAANEIDAARRFVNDADSELRKFSDAIADCDRKTQLLLTALGVATLDEMPDREVLKATIDTLTHDILQNQQETGAIASQLDENKRNSDKARLAEEELKKAEALLVKWDRINKVFGGTRFRTLVQTHILRPLLNNANIYLSQITDRYTLTCSEENDQLSILVYDSYIDPNHKDLIRSVTVLSGGERFMISLALSLALSSLNRQDMNVNILFIDEGFGTLDEKSLDSVMLTLEKLQEIAGQTNRRVGIISHRQELTERIPAKIIVKKKGEGRSHVEVRLE